MTSLFAGRRVLVTGAGGFIGSHVVERLMEEGAAVRAFLRYTSVRETGALAGAAEAEPWFGDLRDPDAVEGAAEGCDTIIHLAAHVSIPHSYLAPREVVETNVGGTLNVLLAARRHGVTRVVCLSSSEVYGTAQTVPITESHPLNAQSPYAASKVAADMLASSFHLSYGVPVGIVRPFNTYGPRQSPRAVIPTILAQGLAGAQVKLGSLDPVRDFTFVDDTVRGILGFAAWQGAPGAAVQLGSGVGVSIGELVRLTGELLGVDLEVESEERRLRPEASEVRRLVCDPSAAYEAFGWRPEVLLREGLERTLAWVEANRERLRADEYTV